MSALVAVERWALLDGAWHRLGSAVPDMRPGDQRMAMACGLPVRVGPGWRTYEPSLEHAPPTAWLLERCARCHR